MKLILIEWQGHPLRPEILHEIIDKTEYCITFKWSAINSEYIIQETLYFDTEDLKSITIIKND